MNAVCHIGRIEIFTNFFFEGRLNMIRMGMILVNFMVVGLMMLKEDIF
jgi:hypothetical protein